MNKHRKTTTLSPQQEQIAMLASLGYTNKEIAHKLDVGPRAIETQFRRMRVKLGTVNKPSTIAKWNAVCQQITNESNKQGAEILLLMPCLFVAFGPNYEIVASNLEFDETFGVEHNNSLEGKKFIKQINPCFDGRERLPPINSPRFKFVDNFSVMQTTQGKRIIKWAAYAHRKVAETDFWAVGMDVTDVIKAVSTVRKAP